MKSRDYRPAAGKLRRRVSTIHKAAIEFAIAVAEPDPGTEPDPVPGPETGPATAPEPATATAPAMAMVPVPATVGAILQNRSVSTVAASGATSRSFGTNPKRTRIETQRNGTIVPRVAEPLSVRDHEYPSVLLPPSA